MNRAPTFRRCGAALALVFWLAAIAFGCCCRSDVSPSRQSVPSLAAIKARRVVRAKQLLATGKQYTRGASDFVCDVLEIPWADADALLSVRPMAVGDGDQYDRKLLAPGDVVGWCRAADGSGLGHVAIYLGEGEKHFIDVERPGQAPRTVDGYAKRVLYKSGI